MCSECRESRLRICGGSHSCSDTPIVWLPNGMTKSDPTKRYLVQPDLMPNNLDICYSMIPSSHLLTKVTSSIRLSNLQSETESVGYLSQMVFYLACR
jgi:hypothetical protein